MTNLLDNLKDIQDLRQKKLNIYKEIEQKEEELEKVGTYSGVTIDVTFNASGYLNIDKIHQIGAQPLN